MWISSTCERKAALGGTRYEGVSAIEKSMFVIESFEKVGRREMTNYRSII